MRANAPTPSTCTCTRGAWPTSTSESLPWRKSGRSHDARRLAASEKGMGATLAFVDRLKRHVVGENFVRRNPFYYDRSRRLLDRLEGMDLEGRRAWTQEQLGRTLAVARRTDYGCIVRGRGDIHAWPLLEKELLRNRLRVFTTGVELFRAPANTGGTAGVPLKLVRSLDGIVFEQACIDRLVTRLGMNPRTVRTAVLRGDNLQDPRTLLYPDGVSANG